MMDRYLIRYFLAVVDQGSFTKAAISCRVTQPTLSVGIAKLERSVGAPLLNRTNRRIELTEAGARLVDHARQIEAAFVAAEFAGQAKDARPLVRLGALASLPGPWLEQALSAARRQAPDERLEIVEAPQKVLLAYLARGRIDAAIAIVPSGGAARRLLFREPYALALPIDHKWSDATSVRAEDLAADTMIVRRHCEALADISRHFTHRGVRPFMAARTMSDERALAYVRTGLGITVMPRCFRTEGIAMPFMTGFELHRQLGVLVEEDSFQRVARTRSYAIFSDTYEALGRASTLD